MDKDSYAVKKLFVDLLIKSYQIFLATLIVGPFVTDKFNIPIFGFGIMLALVCVSFAYIFTKRIQKEEEK